MSVVECAQSVLCQWWNVPGFGLLPAPQMCGCYNFFPWEYTLETECENLWVDINIQYMQQGVRPCVFYNPNEGDAISLENFERSLY